MKKSLWRLLLAVLLIGTLVGVLASCGADTPENPTVTVMDGDTALKTMTLAPDATFSYDDSTFAKAGYDFGGLYTDKELTEAYILGPVSENLTLYAKYTPKTFFLLIDGTERVNVTYGASYTLSTPTREGFRFREFTYMGETFAASGTFTYTQSLPITTAWDRIVKINVFNDGVKVGTYDVNADGTYTLPEVTATKDGYTFGGYLNGAEAFAATGTYTGTTDLDVFYKWDLIPTYTLTVSGLYGDDAVAPAAYETGDTFTLPTAPTREGYYFTGYTVNGQPLTLTEGAATFTWSANTTVVANWRRAATIKVYDGATCVETIVVPANGAYSLTVPQDTADRTFGGFKNGAETFAAAGTYTGEADLTIMQVWNVVPTYILTVNGLYGDDVVDSATYKTGETFALPVAPTREGYIFAGYTVNGQPLTLTEGVATFTWSANTTVVANWTARIYITVRDERTGETLGSVEVVDGAYDLSEYVPAEEDRVIQAGDVTYTYAGFSLDGNAFAVTATAYAGGSVTVTRDWDGVDRIFIDFVSVGANYTAPSIEIVDGTYAPLTTPSLTDYHFIGFYTDADCTAAFDNSGTYEGTTDLTVYIKWQRIVKINIFNDGVKVTTVEVAADGSYTLPTVTATKEGYTFGGYLHGTEDFAASGTYTDTEDLNIFYKWDLIPTYLLTVNGLYENTVAPASYKKGDTFTLPVAPTREGYRFAGYTVNGQPLTLTDGSATFTWEADVVVTATWTQIYYVTVYNGNTALPEKYEIVDGSVTLPAQNNTATHLFVGYTMTGATFTQNPDGTWTATGITGNASAFFAWSQLPKVNFNVNNGAPLTESSMILQPGENVLPIPTRDGFTFAGWTLGGAAFGVKDGNRYVYNFTTWTGALEVTLVASWTDNSSLGEVAGMEYFRELDSTGEIVYVFLTGNKYTFQNYTLTFKNNNGVVTPDGTNAFKAVKNGTFTMILTAADGSTREVYCYVQTKLTALSTGSATASRNEANFKGGIDKTLDVGMQNFIPDLNVKGVKGDGTAGDVLFTDIPYALSIKVWDNDNSTWVTYKGIEGTDYVINDGAISFLDAGLRDRKLQVTIDPDYDLGTSCLYTIEILLNDGVNVYTSDELYAAYSNLNVKSINILRNITATMHSHHTAAGHAASGCPCGNSNESADPNAPINQWEHGVYVRLPGATDTLTIHGNHYTVDGSKLPNVDPRIPASSYGGEPWSANTTYRVANVQLGIFSYYTTVATADASSSSGKLTVEDLYVRGNFNGRSEETISSTVEGEVPILAGSFAFHGFVVRNANLDVINSKVELTNIPFYANGSLSTDENNAGNPSRLYTAINLVNTIADHSFMSTFYAWGQVGVNVTSSYIGQSTGAAFHFDDSTIQKDNPHSSYLMLSDDSVVENYVAGTEAWFQAFNVQPAVGPLKGGLKDNLAPVGFTPINPNLTGAEFLNLILVVKPASNTFTTTNSTQDQAGFPYVPIYNGRGQMAPLGSPVLEGTLYTIAGGCGFYLPNQAAGPFTISAYLEIYPLQ